MAILKTEFSLSASAIRGKALRPLHPNVGDAAAYARKLESLIEAMHKSILWWVSAKYKAKEDDIVAQDESPAAALDRVMKRLSWYWKKRFADASQELAKYFAQNSVDRTTQTLRNILKDAGIVVEFKLTPELVTVMQAVVKANVSLIKSIQSQHFTAIEGMVMRSVQQGGDYGGLAKDLEKQYGITKRRARFIASDQNRKAASVVQKVRQTEAGIVDAEWLHSHGQAHPRPEHLNEFDGKRYKVAEGMWSEVDKRYVWPGTPPGCACVAKPVIPGM